MAPPEKFYFFNRNIGLDIQPEKLVWRAWEIGEEYTKNLIIKNTSFQTKKIK